MRRCPVFCVILLVCFRICLRIRDPLRLLGAALIGVMAGGEVPVRTYEYALTAALLYLVHDADVREIVDAHAVAEADDARDVVAVLILHGGFHVDGKCVVVVVSAERALAAVEDHGFEHLAVVDAGEGLLAVFAGPPVH